nr:MAG TPA_asm: hypothetical protein [Caudoviricetes sp.]
MSKTVFCQNKNSDRNHCFFSSWAYVVMLIACFKRMFKISDTPFLYLSTA